MSDGQSYMSSLVVGGDLSPTGMSRLAIIGWRLSTAALPLVTAWRVPRLSRFCCFAPLSSSH